MAGMTQKELKKSYFHCGPMVPWSHGPMWYHAETVKSLRQKELYWYHKLKTYAPFGLNERDVYAAY